RNRLNATLVSSSSMNVLRGTSAMTLFRSATPSYSRRSFLSSAPSPNQPPVGTAMKLTDLPSGETLATLTNPSSTPIQCSADSPLRQTKPPTDIERIVVSAKTRRRSSSDKPCAHRELRSATWADTLGAARFMVMRFMLACGGPRLRDGSLMVACGWRHPPYRQKYRRRANSNGPSRYRAAQD